MKKFIYPTIRSQNITKKSYKGKVWCITSEDGLMVTRRKGIVGITGNSSMIAQNPFVREIEDWQDFFQTYYKEFFRRVISAKVEHGDLPEGTNTDCDMEWLPLITADIKKNNEARQIQFKNKVLSRKTWQNKEGLDPEEEERNMIDEDGKDIYKAPFNLPLAPANQFGQIEDEEELEE